MSHPTRGGLKKLKRLGRYLKGRPRAVMEYNWQGECAEVEGYGDSNWAGCRITGRSTSGGVIMKRGHWVKSWSRTQKTVALSSVEAELIAMTKVTAELIAVGYLLSEWGQEKRCVVYADASAALA